MMLARQLRLLAKASSDEGKRLAREVRRGRMTRAQIEDVHKAFPGDIEPVIALEWLDKWGIK